MEPNYLACTENMYSYLKKEKNKNSFLKFWKYIQLT